MDYRGSSMDRFKRGDELWARRDDGTWARWERAQLVWTPAEPPPLEDLEPFAVPDMTGLMPAPRQPKPRRARTVGGSIAGLSVFHLIIGGIVVFFVFSLIFLVLWGLRELPG
jgi:hypothetical protein